VAAWIWRKRFRLASYGWLVFLILIAPTSSLVPIADAMAERRLYLPFIGLALMAAEGLARWRPAHAFQAAVVLVLLLLGGVSYARNKVYGSAIAMWEDSTAKNPANGRAHFNLGYAYYLDGRCGAATAAYERSAQLRAVDYDLLVDWALALDCDGKPAAALVKLDQATSRERNAHAWSLKGMVHGKQRQAELALAALAEAEKIDPQYAMTYVYRGNVLVQAGRAAAALAPFQRALELAPDNPAAQAGLQAARQALAGGTR
jgi:tetratricopeptide (TPR) repeat protein